MDHPGAGEGNTAHTSAPEFLTGTICTECGAALSAADFRPAPLVPVPVNVSTRRVPNGQEVISIVGGLELNTPVWANEQHEFPYLQWQMEVHRAKLKASYPHVANKIQMGAPESAAADAILENGVPRNIRWSRVPHPFRVLERVRLLTWSFLEEA